MSKSEDERILNQFWSFCTTVLVNEKKLAYNERKRQRKQEIQFSVVGDDAVVLNDLESQISKKEFVFHVHGVPVVVIGDSLASAIKSLSEKDRDLILLSYFMGLSDREIGRRLNQVHQTVSRHRSKSIEELRKYFEKEGIDCTDL